MGGNSSKKEDRRATVDALFAEGEELPETARERKLTTHRMKHGGKSPEHVNKVEASNKFSGSMKSLKSNATMSEASWYTDNSSVQCIEHENYEYPFENVVFEGGGIKGIAYCGVVRELERIGVWKNIKRLAGASAGAMQAAMLAVGYNADETETFLRVDVRPFALDATCGACTLLPNMFKHFGWHPARKLFNWFGDRIYNKTGNRDITFEQLYKLYGKELCIIVTNLNRMDVEYCHVKTTPNLSIRLAVRMSMAIPGLFCAVQFRRYGRIYNYVDGGMLCNYPIHCFDGWFLSLKPEDSFLRKLQPLDDLARLWDMKERFGSLNTKTLGMLLFSTNEQELMAAALTNNVQHEDPPNRPNTKLSIARKKIRNKKRDASREHAVVTKALTQFLKVLADNQLDDKDTISKEELKAVFHNSHDSFTDAHARELFGDEYNVDDVFEYLDCNEDGEISFHELIAFAEQRGVGLHTQFVGYEECKINSFKEFLSTLQDTLLVNVKRVFVAEQDIDRTIGIDTLYIQTTDWNLEVEDKDFLVQQGERAARSYLRQYVRNNQPPLKPEFRPEDDNETAPSKPEDTKKERSSSVTKEDSSRTSSGFVEVEMTTGDNRQPQSKTRPPEKLLIAEAANGQNNSGFSDIDA